MKTNWIRCDERMPEAGNQVFLYTPNKEFYPVHKGAWFPREWQGFWRYEYWEVNGLRDLKRNEVTHWAEFGWPDPPIEGGEDEGNH